MRLGPGGLEGCENKSMRPMFKTKLLIYHSKAKLDVKILLGKITKLYDPKIRKNVSKGQEWEREVHVPFWSMICLLLKAKFSLRFYSHQSAYISCYLLLLNLLM